MANTKHNATTLLEKTLELNASDLLLSVGNPPFVRVNNLLSPIAQTDILTASDVEFFLSQILQADQRDILEVNKENF